MRKSRRAGFTISEGRRDDVADITNKLVLQDGMSKVLAAIEKRADAVLKKLEAIDAAANRQTSGGSGLTKSLGETENSAQRARKAIENVQRTADGLNNTNTERLNTSLSQTEKAAQKAADKMTTIQTKSISVASKSANSFLSFKSKIISTAQSAASGFVQKLNTIKNGVSSVASKAASAFQKMRGAMSQANSMGGQLFSTIRNIAAALGGIAGAKALVQTSDSMQMIESRLNLITGSQEENAALQEQIFQSANRSRGAYKDSADLVAKLGMLAGKQFTGNEQIVDFAEILNKSFALSGTDQVTKSGALTQLVQGLTSGALAGDELRSVRENAPMIAQAIEQYAQKANGTQLSLKEMGAEGMLTPDIVVQAVLGMKDQINAQFETLPLTWESIWTLFKNKAVKAMNPLLDKINELANNGQLQAWIDNIVDKIGVLSEKAAGFIDYIVNNGDKAKNIFIAIGVALAAIKIAPAVSGIISALMGLGGGKGSGGGLLGSLAKAKPTDVLKAVANIGIIVGGLTAIAAGLMALAPYISQLSDLGSITKLVAVLGEIGIVGSVMAKLSGIIGKIPVSSVALGLANIAIIVAGLSALYLVIGAVSLADFDTQRIAQITLILGEVGLVGATMALFAGIVGAIPVPAVLLGLANIALALGGLTAVISAYSLLGKIPGFDDFINRGAEVLSNLFGALGRVAGSLAGGIAESLTNSLPRIGENLSAFANAIKPMFSMLKGIDMGAAGGFFSSLGSFLTSIPKDGGFLQKLTGSADIAAVGEKLAEFGEKAAPFFTTASTIDASGATAIFEAVKKAGELSELNFGDLANKGRQLSDFIDNAKGFFTGAGEVQAQSEAVSGLAETIRNFFATIASTANSDLSTISAGVQDVTSYVQTSNTEFTTYGDTIEAACNKGETAFMRLRDTAQLKMQEIVNTVQNNVNSIKSIFERIDLKTTGENVMQGFLDGLKSKGSSVLDYARSIATDIANTMNGALQVGSPSKVMRRIGQYTFEGFELGLADRIKGVFSKVDMLTGGIFERLKTPTVAANVDYGSFGADDYGNSENFAAIRGAANNAGTTTIIHAPVNVTIENENNIDSEMDLSDIIKRMSTGIYAQVSGRLEADYGV